MTSIEDDIALGRSVELQFRLIAEAYESGNEDAFDQAVIHVESVRRLRSAGILDLWELSSSDRADTGPKE